MPIPIHANIYDLQPIETLWGVIDDKHDPPDIYTKEELYESIKKHGLLYPLKVDREGNILNGNCRYWILRRLVEEGHTEFQYVPIEYDDLTGFYMYPYNEEKTPQENIQQSTQYIANVKIPVTPSNIKFKEYEVDPKDPRKLTRYKDTIKDQDYDCFFLRSRYGRKIIYFNHDILKVT